MKDFLLTTLNNYLSAKQHPYSENKQQAHYLALSSGIVKTLETWLKDYADPSLNYQVSWSHGKGNWAEIPWLLCTNTAITKSAQRGYYLGILFSADMSSCFMGLLQGVTDARPEDLQDFSALAIEYIGTNSNYKNLHLGSIDLKATKDLGKKYQKFAIKSFEYSKSFLENATDSKLIEEQFAILVRDYELLYHNANTDITNLSPISSQSYQAIIHSEAKDLGSIEVIENIEAVPDILSTQQSRHKRSKDKSQRALKLADYKCEIESSHETFTTVHDHPYVEGHHLVPMSQQSNFQVSLDVTSNIISLCPNCHKALHYGNKSIVSKKLKILFSKRNERLQKQGIHLSEKELEKIYIKSGLDQQYD